MCVVCIPPSSKELDSESTYHVSMDDLIPQLQSQYPKAVSFELHYPATDTSSIYVETKFNEGIHYNVDYLFFDQYSLKELETACIYV